MSAPLPPNLRLLTVDEAVDRITRGDHAEGAKGGLEMDVALIDTLRAGVVEAAFDDATNKLHFRMVTP